MGPDAGRRVRAGVARAGVSGGVAAGWLVLLAAVGVVLLGSARPARATIISPPRVRDAIDIQQAYVISVTSRDFTGDTTYLNVTVTADDPHDSLLLYTTSDACASSYDRAFGIFNGEAHGDELADLDLGEGAIGLRWTRVARRRYTLRLRGHGLQMQQPGQYARLCAMLYDATGDPPQSLYPHGIKQNHVWKRAQAKLPTGAP